MAIDDVQAECDADHPVCIDAKTARTVNIRLLVTTAGGPTAFADQSGGRWTQAQVSQWISDKSPKSIGHTLAREIEACVGLDHGSLDRPPTGNQAGKIRETSFSHLASRLFDHFHSLPTQTHGTITALIALGLRNDANVADAVRGIDMLLGGVGDCGHLSSTLGETIGERIGYAIRCSGKSDAEIARALNITPQSVSSWKRTGRISKESLLYLSDISGCSPESILGSGA